MSALARAAAALALAGCASLPAAPKPSPEAAPWAQARDGASRHVKLYDGFATRAFATATWESPAVRAERLALVADWKAMSAEERAAAKAADDSDASSYDEFTLALFTPDRADNDLDAARTAWRVAVADAAGDRLPVRVEQVRSDALLRTLYPDVGDFDVVYRLRFNRREGAPLAPPFTLRVAGPRGMLEFVY